MAGQPAKCDGLSSPVNCISFYYCRNALCVLLPVLPVHSTSAFVYREREREEGNETERGIANDAEEMIFVDFFQQQQQQQYDQPLQEASLFLNSFSVSARLLLARNGQIEMTERLARDLQSFEYPPLDN